MPTATAAPATPSQTTAGRGQGTHRPRRAPGHAATTDAAPTTSEGDSRPSPPAEAPQGAPQAAEPGTRRPLSPAADATPPTAEAATGATATAEVPSSPPRGRGTGAGVGQTASPAGSDSSSEAPTLRRGRGRGGRKRAAARGGAGGPASRPAASVAGYAQGGGPAQPAAMQPDATPSDADTAAAARQEQLARYCEQARVQMMDPAATNKQKATPPRGAPLFLGKNLSGIRWDKEGLKQRMSVLRRLLHPDKHSSTYLLYKSYPILCVLLSCMCCQRPLNAASASASASFISSHFVCLCVSFLFFFNFLSGCPLDYEQLYSLGLEYSCPCYGYDFFSMLFRTSARWDNITVTVGF